MINSLKHTEKGDKPDINIIIPLYNEEEVFPLLIERLNALMQSFESSIEVILVNDGSKDKTPVLMKALSLIDKRYHSVFLSRNYGHQLALSAGLKECTATKGIMVIDGDLQDPPELLSKFYSLFNQGYEVIYAVRKNRKESKIKKMSYYLFYRILKRISQIDLPMDSGDFAFMSRRVVDILNKMPESSRYLRGMRTWIGFNQIGLEYSREERAAGEPKYNMSMLFKLAYNGIFNFSILPIKFISVLGMVAVLASLLYFFIVLYLRLFTDSVPSGFTATLLTVILFGGVQLISLGVLGEYMIRIFFQVKNRPLYIVESKIQNSVEKKEEVIIS